MRKVKPFKGRRVYQRNIARDLAFGAFLFGALAFTSLRLGLQFIA